MSNFWKNVSSVFAGTLVAQSIPIIGSLFIARIFAPSEFGEFSTWLAIVTFVSIVVTLRFEAMLAIAADGMDRVKAVFIIFAVTIMTAVLIFICMIAASFFPSIRHYFPGSAALLLMIVPAALCLALNQIWQTWAAAEGLYSKLNAMRLVQASTLVLAQIGIGFKYPAAISLVVGFVAATGIAFLCSIKLMPSCIDTQFFRVIEFKKFFSRYKSFPLYALPADAINTAAGQLPVLVISYRFGHEVAGYLALTMRVLGAPIGLVGKAVLDVFKRYAIQSIQKTGNCQSLYIKTLMSLLLASIFLVAGTVFLAEDIFRVAFGAEWIPASRMAIWLLPMFAMRMIASPLSYMAYLVERQHIDLIWQAALMLVTVATLYVFHSYESTLIGYSAAYAAMYILYILISYKLSKGEK
ncbi:lipopolysaccharide biosynthesis protein [Comamonas sp.]|uniref:lipopolysaccharide biosynthesis protein n=1 Tax=Comamonas sp. TaxID=34028 RepID=UPI003A913EE0